MEISGTLRAYCPPEDLVATLADARAITRLLPGGAQVEQTGEGRYSFTVSRAFGPIKLTLPGQMTITATGQGHDRRLVLRAAHIIGGKVDMEITFHFELIENATRMRYDGTLEATGLAGRVAREHRARINTVVKGGLTRLKHLAEARNPKAAGSAEASAGSPASSD